MRSIFFVFVWYLFFVSPVLAADSPEKANAPLAAQGEGAVDCFDYYRFGSVQVDLSADLEQTVPGAPMTFSGVIKNDNDYPIVDGSVYVKIFRMIKEDEQLIAKDGYPLVDQFALPNIFVLPAKGESPASFTWNVPMNAPDGDYFAAFFFQSAKRYNLLGLSFTDDVTGNQAPFTITNQESAPIVAFNKHTVTLNGKPHAFTAFPLHFKADEDVTAEIEVVNPKNTKVAVSLDWRLYAWDGLRDDTLSDTRTEVIELKPNEKKKISYTVAPLNTSVSFLVVKMNDGYSNSFLGIRFVRDGVVETRINFPSIMSYPLRSGTETTLFSCAHSTALPIVPNNVLTLTLKDDQGATIHTYTYEGDITGSMMGVADSFTPTKDYANFSLTATLKRDGILVEEVTQSYRCQDIDPALCPKTGFIGSADSFFDNFPKMVGIVLIIALALVGIIMALWGATKRRRGTTVFLFVSMGLCFGVQQAEAKSVSWTSNTLPALAYYWANLHNAWTDAGATTEGSVGCGHGGCGWNLNLYDVTASVIYKAKLFNVDTGLEVPDNSVIPVGTRLRVDSVAKADTDISWNGTGLSADSPYGHWVNNAGPRADLGCAAGDRVATLDPLALFGADEIYNQFNVHPENPIRSGVTGNLSCNAGICTVTGPGAISLGMHYPETYGKFYHRYLATFYFGQACGGNNVPLRQTNIDCYAGFCWFSCNGQSCLGGSDYKAVIPAQTITFNLSAVQPNNAPNAPVLAGPASGNQNASLVFSATATDPDGDSIRYLFDWNNDGIGDQWSGGGAWVASGTAQNLPRIWASPGTYTFQARTQDSKGSFSGWTQKTVTINAFIDGACGVASTSVSGIDLSAAPVSGLCNAGNATAVLGTGPWTWNCNGIGAGSTSASCQADLFIPAPIVNLSISPANVDLGDSATLTWSVLNPADTCTASSIISASWNGVRATSGSESVTPTASGSYTLTCTNIAEGKSGTKTVGITLNNKLKICENSCNSTLDRTGQTFSVNQGPDRHLKACFNPYPSCTNPLGNVTNLAFWDDTNAPSNAFSFPAKGELRPLPFNATENFDVSYGGVTKSAVVQVVCVPNSCSIPAAKAVTDTYCPETVQDTHVPTGCDGETLICPGTRHCDYNVKEVSP